MVAAQSLCGWSRGSVSEKCGARAQAKSSIQELNSRAQFGLMKPNLMARADFEPTLRMKHPKIQMRSSRSALRNSRRLEGEGCLLQLANLATDRSMEIKDDDQV
jgi:hypothetical protein